MAGIIMLSQTSKNEYERQSVCYQMSLTDNAVMDGQLLSEKIA